MRVIVNKLIYGFHCICCSESDNRNYKRKTDGGHSRVVFPNSLQQYLLENGCVVGKKWKAKPDGRLVTITEVSC